MEFPEAVIRFMGHALHEAQAGDKSDSAKPLQGFGGAGVLEIVEDHDGDTYRAVYTVKLAGTVYFLHCFQKKSKRGIETPKPIIDLIKRRLKTHTRQESDDMSKQKQLTDDTTITPISGNVFADLGLKDADTLMAKSVLAIHIKRAIKSLGLTQAGAARILGLDQPKVSAITSGRLDGFSVDRLMRFLNELGCDVQISVSTPHPESRGNVMFA